MKRMKQPSNLAKESASARPVERRKTYTSEDIRRAIFPTPPRRRSRKEIQEGVAEGIREKYGRR